MTGGAIAMMLVAMAVLWGGLAAAIVNIVRSGRQQPKGQPRDL